jgi:hypothetical protein
MAVEPLVARDGDAFQESMQELATLQSALTAVQEVIETHGGRLGWLNAIPPA